MLHFNLKEPLLSEKHFDKNFHFTDESDIIEISCSSSDSLCSETGQHICDKNCLNVKICEVLDSNFGLYVWPCAPVLSKYIWTHRKKMKKKIVLELGAGTALPSIVAAKCGANIIVTDSQKYKYVLQLGEYNMQLNGVKQDVFKIIELTWGKFTPHLISIGCIDIILGSDVFYDPADFEDVLVTVSYVMKSNTKAEFWFTYEHRCSDWNIYHLLEKWNLKCEEVPLNTFGADKFNVAGSDLPGLKAVRKILKKPYFERTEEENKILDSVPELVHHIESTIKKHKNLKEREKEVYDAPEILSSKCEQLAKALKESTYTVVYTGAGISTSAHIPDYRGPNGIWTLLQKGKKITFKDLSLAEPTFTHMALKQLHKEGYVSHIVSQNCDGLHLRSGIPKAALSELHGNMFIEVCPKCKPFKQFVRLFDVTERTALHRHKTGRFCKKCKSELNDTIVHFGEKGTLNWPMNWKGAVKAVSKAKLILCLGTSLKVLRRYQSLWATDKPHEKRPKLYIVNLQWTPKDSQATLKIHGKCDEVMKEVISCLGITVPKYEKESDPIFRIATPLRPNEFSTTTRHCLSKTSDSNCLSHVKSEISNSVDKYEDTIQTENKPSSESLGSTDQKEISVDVLPDGNVDLKLNSYDRTDGEFENPDDVDHSMNSVSGWYGKGCARLRKRKKSSTINKRLKKDDVL